MSRIFITGVDGIVGTVLKRGLDANHEVSGVDFPVDLASVPALAESLCGVQTVIHLARERNDPEASLMTARVNPRNIEIDVNVFAGVIEAQVERVVFASSVHADDFRGEGASPLFAAPGSYHPATPYGTYKLIGEEVGGALARRFGFEFVAIRLGGVTEDDSVKDGPGRAATWLSHCDLLGAVSASIFHEPVRGRATVFYAVSKNATRVHDTSNPFGWTPRDDSGRVQAADAG
jgi:uronate dehydrogenase